MNEPIQEKKRPIKVFRMRGWARYNTVTIWKNKEGYMFTIGKQVKQPDGTYKNSYNFYQNEVGALYFLLGEALRWVMTQDAYSSMSPEEIFADSPEVFKGIVSPLVGRNGDDAELLARYQEDNNSE